MKVDKLNPQPKDKKHFKYAAYKSVPKAAGCYVLATFDNEILYIGLSENINSRFQQHLDNPQKTNPTKEGKAIWFYYLIYNVNNLPHLERTWLNQFVALNGRLPILNKIESPLS